MVSATSWVVLFTLIVIFNITRASRLGPLLPLLSDAYPEGLLEQLSGFPDGRFDRLPPGFLDGRLDRLPPGFLDGRLDRLPPGFPDGRLDRLTPGFPLLDGIPDRFPQPGYLYPDAIPDRWQYPGLAFPGYQDVIPGPRQGYPVPVLEPVAIPEPIAVPEFIPVPGLPGMGLPPPPPVVIVDNNNNDRWEKLLPLLLILFTGC